MKGIADKVEQLEERQSKLSEKVNDMEVVQGGLIEAVKDVRRTLDKMVDMQSKFVYMIVASLWGAVVIGVAMKFI